MRQEVGLQMPTKTKRKASAGNRIGMAVIAVVVTALIIIMLVLSHGLKNRIDAYETTNQALSQAIAEENGRSEELKTLPDYVQSDAFIEKTAREKFGLAYENEVIFRAEEP